MNQLLMVPLHWFSVNIPLLAADAVFAGPRHLDLPSAAARSNSWIGKGNLKDGGKEIGFRVCIFELASPERQNGNI